MIAALLATCLALGQPTGSVTYESVPVQVTAVHVYEWEDGSRPAEASIDAVRDGTNVVLRGASRSSVVVTFRTDDGAYLIDGPFAWPSHDDRRALDDRWRRTDTGVIPPDAADVASVRWIRADALPDPWPRCFRDRHLWVCWGVQISNRGVLVVDTPGHMWSAVTAPLAGTPLRASTWGRLLILSDDGQSPTGAVITFGRPVAPPPGRLAAIRLDTAIVAGARSSPISAGVVWRTGDDIPPRSWVEVRTSRAGPVYLPLQDVAEAPSSVPLQVAVAERRILTGTVSGASGQPAPRALVTVFRLVDPPAVPGSRLKPRRVFASETVAGEDGTFQIDGIGEADYEIAAWHSQMGRASSAVGLTQQQIHLRLAATGTVRGRVLAGGQPLAGVEVTSVPDPATFNGTEDLMDAKGGDARTAADGRFSVMTAPAGGGELRIGGGVHAVKRIPLPRSPLPSLDLGDIELGAPIEIVVTLDRDVQCGVRAVGPIGRTGLQIASAERTAERTFRLAVPEVGVYQFGLVCGAVKRALMPGSRRIEADDAGKELKFVVR